MYTYIESKTHSSAAIPERRETGSAESASKSQLLADDVCVYLAPVVVAHGTPGSSVEHLHPALSLSVPVDQSHQSMRHCACVCEREFQSYVLFCRGIGIAQHISSSMLRQVLPLCLKHISVCVHVQCMCACFSYVYMYTYIHNYTSLSPPHTLPQLTMAPNSCVLVVSTIVLSQSRRKALSNDTLAPETIDIVEPNGLIIWSRSEVAVGESLVSPLEPQVPTRHLLCVCVCVCVCECMSQCV